ncbi:hypothetical protein EI94DRAFT_1704049 [Lactarius quietus]|nr:hypothetical protein EI94DRAFT_1704049 [Lactarius quietus]
MPHCHPILQIMGTRWGTAEKGGMPPDWTGLTLETVTQYLQPSKAPTWHQDLFAHDLTPYLSSGGISPLIWLLLMKMVLNMEESPHDPSPAPPLPPMPPASQKCAAKGMAWAVPPPPPPNEYGPPQTHHTRSRKHSTVLPDSDSPADTPSKGEADKDTPTCLVLPQGLLHVDMEGPSPLCC